MLLNNFLLPALKVYVGESSITTVDQEVAKQVGKSGSIVLELLKPLFGHGYKLFVDNWYTSHSLFKYLDEKAATSACGTVRRNRVKFPKQFLSEKL